MISFSYVNDRMEIKKNVQGHAYSELPLTSMLTYL